MIFIHHLGISQSDRIVWLMEELGLPYELKWYDRGPDFLAPPEYRALHPAGTAPIIEDGDLLMTESTAIVEYISQRHGKGRLSVSVESPDYPHYLYWMQFNNNLQAALFIKRSFQAAEYQSLPATHTVQASLSEGHGNSAAGLCGVNVGALHLCEMTQQYNGMAFVWGRLRAGTQIPLCRLG